MTNLTGWFDLQTAADLREKLRRDLEKLKANRFSVDAAFNFFVTAEHMLDWVYPQDVNNSRRASVRQGSVLLRVCSHLANGAKHFIAEARRHDTVSSGGLAGGVFPPAAFPPAAFPNAAFGAGRRLVVQLEGDAEAEFGPIIEVIDLAERVMAYWEAHPLK